MDGIAEELIRWAIFGAISVEFEVVQCAESKMSY
jgi:hypothetical protein